MNKNTPHTPKNRSNINSETKQLDSEYYIQYVMLDP